MHPLVRDLYKRVLLVGRDYPGGLDVVRRKAKEYFAANAHLTDEDEIVKAVASGRWYVNNELVGVIKLKKYRTIAKKYGYIEPDDAPSKSSKPTQSENT